MGFGCHSKDPGSARASCPPGSVVSTGRRPRHRARAEERRTGSGLEHEAGVEPACFGFKAQRGCRQPTARVLGSGGRNRTCVGCVLQRCWDASNPHLNDFGGPSRNRTLLTGFGDQPPPRGQPELAERGEPESHAAGGTVCFPDNPRPCQVHAPRWRKAVGLDPHIREDATRFRNEGARPRTSPSKPGRG
jgi:hypothetical protein